MLPSAARIPSRRSYDSPRALVLALLAAVACVAVPTAALAADRYIAPSGSDSAPCTAAAPCQSLARAYQAAAPGQSIEVAGGSYPTQTVPYVASHGAGADVVVRSAAGATPSFNQLNIAGTHVDIGGIATGFVDIKPGNGGAPADVTVRNGRGNGLFVGGGTQRIRIIGGSYGGGAPNQTPVKVQGSPAPTDVTFDGVLFHDAVRTQEGAHLECLYAADVQRFTVRNSAFRNCAIMNLFLTKLSGVDPNGVTVENTFFDRTGSHGGDLSKGYYALQIGGAISSLPGLVLRNNSFNQPIWFEAPTPGARIVNNVGELSNCPKGATFSHNVWSGVRCGASDKQAPTGFADPANYDLHLKPGAAAINAGDPSDAPATDIDGGARPPGAPPTRARDESGSGNPANYPVPSGGGFGVTPPAPAVVPPAPRGGRRGRRQRAGHPGLGGAAHAADRQGPPRGAGHAPAVGGGPRPGAAVRPGPAHAREALTRPLAPGPLRACGPAQRPLRGQDPHAPGRRLPHQCARHRSAEEDAAPPADPRGRRLIHERRRWPAPRSSAPVARAIAGQPRRSLAARPAAPRAARSCCVAFAAAVSAAATEARSPGVNHQPASSPPASST